MQDLTHVGPSPVEPPAPKVSVAMLAYNHGKFITQAIESVLMQKTDFRVELVIGEDESSDETRAICIQYAEKYPERIRLFLRSRKDPDRLNYPPSVFYNWAETLKACRGQYIAHLDGDDYWTDEHKLAIQVAVLEKHPETVLCSHRYQRLQNESHDLTPDCNDLLFNGHEHVVATYQDFLAPPLLLSSFIVYPRTALDGLFQKASKWDTTLWAHLLSRGGNAIILNRYMGVYRRHSGGVWSMLPPREQLKCSFEQNCMLIENEGFRSQCIESSFFAVTKLRSASLASDTSAALTAWKNHAQYVLRLTSQRKDSSSKNLARGIIGLVGAIQERLVKCQMEYLNMVCTPGRTNSSQLVNLALIGLWMVAASPMIALAFLTQLRRHWISRKGNDASPQEE